jgi:hypothetical protein
MWVAVELSAIVPATYLEHCATCSVDGDVDKVERCADRCFDRCIDKCIDRCTNVLIDVLKEVTDMLKGALMY